MFVIKSASSSVPHPYRVEQVQQAVQLLAPSVQQSLVRGAHCCRVHPGARSRWHARGQGPGTLCIEPWLGQRHREQLHALRVLGRWCHGPAGSSTRKEDQFKTYITSNARDDATISYTGFSSCSIEVEAAHVDLQRTAVKESIMTHVWPEGGPRGVRNPLPPYHGTRGTAGSRGCILRCSTQPMDRHGATAVLAIQGHNNWVPTHDHCRCCARESHDQRS